MIHRKLLTFCSVRFGGRRQQLRRLLPVYFWRVKIIDNNGERQENVERNLSGTVTENPCQVIVRHQLILFRACDDFLFQRLSMNKNLLTKEAEKVEIHSFWRGSSTANITLFRELWSLITRTTKILSHFVSTRLVASGSLKNYKIGHHSMLCNKFLRLSGNWREKIFIRSKQLDENLHKIFVILR